ncbi:hypothetical protein UCDDS831_g04715 [Diplodia seriata]|uniref:DUF2423 domain-containing protein n=1 Tax=Diplodia seriata TaxID=420778 RepID=A0A0G2GAJ1_9PEZI|nr:hypothetical protein UCDDS831_g04715 [Diplodia seriata]
MAKGSRSSVRKTNNQALKRKVFGPVETARTERLSQKLLELAQQPAPSKNEMEVEKDEPENGAAQAKAPADQAEAMEVDGAKPSMSSLKKKSGRVQKKRRGKSTSTITFTNLRKGKAAGKKGGKR